MVYTHTLHFIYRDSHPVTIKRLQNLREHGSHAVTECLNDFILSPVSPLSTGLRSVKNMKLDNSGGTAAGSRKRDSKAGHDIKECFSESHEEVDGSTREG